MNLQDYVDKVMKEERTKRFSESDQMSLGQIIAELDKLAQKQKKIKEKYGHEARIVFDFENLYPTNIDSWRGSYSELALEFACNGEPMEFSAFLKMLKNAVGQTFLGYKGGEFVMTEDTPVWVANYGNCGNTAVVGVVDNEYEIILMTGWREF